MPLPAFILDFHFEELPLVVDLGIEAGLIEGYATINVYGYDDWSISEINLVGWKDRKETQVRLCKDAHQWLYHAILDQLENGEFRKSIETEIQVEAEAAA